MSQHIERKIMAKLRREAFQIPEVPSTISDEELHSMLTHWVTIETIYGSYCVYYADLDKKPKTPEEKEKAKQALEEKIRQEREESIKQAKIKNQQNRDMDELFFSKLQRNRAARIASWVDAGNSNVCN